MRKLYFLIIMCLTVSMLSASVVKTITTTTAGSLSTLIAADESTTVTDLIVTGPVDAQDFKFMRDNMTVLASLNLASADIMDYNGTNGTLSANVTDYPSNTVPSSAFKTTAGKVSLVAVVLPNSIVTIDASAFNKCTGLTTINIPSTVSTIGSMCFMNCSSLTSVTLPQGIVSIATSTFFGCAKLTTVVIPSTVTTINSGAFRVCTGLTSFVFPSSIITIGAQIFQGCTALTSVDMSAASGLTTSGNSTFAGCTSLTSVTLPSSVTLIEQMSFSGCSALKTFVIPSTVKTLGGTCFLGCSSLLSIEIPSSVVTTALSMFMGCSSLATVIFQENLNSSFMGNQSFKDCLGLKEIYLYRTKVPLNISNAFFENVAVGNVKLYVPSASLALYQADPFWKTFQSISAITTSTGVSAQQEDDLKVYTSPSGIEVISTVANELIEVYSTLGVRLVTTRSEVGPTTIVVPKGAIYIVRMGGKTSKVIL